MAEESVSEDADDEWIAHIRRTLDSVEPAIWGYREMDSVLFEALADAVGAFAQVYERAQSFGTTNAVVARLREHIALKYPELARRLPDAELRETLIQHAKVRGKKDVWLHDLAKKSGIGVGTNIDADRVKRAKARARRYPKL